MRAAKLLLLSLLWAAFTYNLYGATRPFVSQASSDNSCAALGWQAAVDTDLAFSDFFKRNHTIALRFMIQYPRAYQAPLLYASGGGYMVAIAGYGEGRVKAERLLVTIGQRKFYYTVGGKLSAERWHWLAVVRDGSRLLLYLNGSLVKPDDGSVEIETESPAGNLRLGRKTSGDEQFYGLIDDVTVFDSALSQKSLKAYYQESPRLTGREAGLIAAFLFDKSDDAFRATQRRLFFTPPAYEVKVSETRDNALDAARLPPPFNATRMRLPFAPGQQWKVIQGYGQELSHNGGGCFSWDFARVDGPSAGEAVFASAPARVVAVSDNNDPEPGDAVSKDNFNYVQMETAPGEFLTYLHMKNGSIIEALKRVAPASFPEIFSPFPLPEGAVVGRVGNTWVREQPENWHLHFASVPYLNSPVSIPLAFSDYELYEPGTRTWRRVERGVPLQNQIVRNPLR